MNMQLIKTNFKKRRLHCSNFYGFSKSSCRVVVTPQTLGSPIFPFFHYQVPFYNSSTKALKGSIKIHFRSFLNRRSCFNFKQKLKKKFISFSNKKLIIRTNVRGTRIQYYYKD